MTNLFALITLLLTSPLAQEEEKFELKWRFEKGQKLRYETVQKVSARKPYETRLKRHIGYIREVLSVNEAGEACGSASNVSRVKVSIIASTSCSWAAGFHRPRCMALPCVQHRNASSGRPDFS